MLQRPHGLFGHVLAIVLQEYHGGKIKDAKVLFPAMPTPRKAYGFGNSKSALIDREGVRLLLL